MSYVVAGDEIKANQINLIHSLHRPLNVRRTEQGIEVLAKYSVDHDIKFTIRKMSVNQTYQLGDMFLVDNKDITVSANFSDETTKLYEQYTDMISPWFELLAVNNIDGDNTGVGMYTGGWHGYDNKNSGTPTSKSESIVCYADDIVISSGERKYCRELKVVVTNLIQGGNTKKEDGTGRAILKEVVVYRFCGTSIYVEVSAEALEDLTISQYYFLQFQRAFGFEKQFVVVGDDTQTKRIEEYAVNVDGGMVPENKVNKMLFEGNNHCCELTIDTEYGEGNYRYNDGKRCWHHRDFGKAYCDIISRDSSDPLKITAGSILYFRGAYRFLERG